MRARRDLIAGWSWRCKMKRTFNINPFISRARNHLQNKNNESIMYAALELRNAIETIAFHQIRRQYTKFIFKGIWTTKKGKWKKLEYTKKTNFLYSGLSRILHVSFNEEGIEDNKLDESYNFLKECLASMEGRGDFHFTQEVFFVCDCETKIRDVFIMNGNLNFIQCEGCEQIYEMEQGEDGRICRYELSKDESKKILEWIKKQKQKQK